MHNCNCNHKKPSLAKKILTPIAVMVGTELIKEPAKKLFTEFVKSNMVKTYYIEPICCDLIDWLKDNFKHFPIRMASTCSIEKEDLEYEELDMYTPYDCIEQHIVDYAIIEGIPCKLVARSVKVTGESCSTDTTISTININGWPAKLQAIITREAAEGAKRHRVKEAKIMKVVDQHTARFVDSFKRSFDDVFVPADIKNQITSALDHFMGNADWYIKNKIPYHFGIMLHGSPGTGKTSIAQAIATYTKATMYVVSGDDVLKLPSMINNGRVINTIGLTKNDFNIILIEDIDCGLSYKSLYARGSRGGVWATDWDDEEKLDKLQDNNGLATVLNIIDGIGAPRNTIFIFTTNNIEDLDPALIRPGRIDLSLEIKPVCLETFKEFMVHHFGEDIKLPKNLKIREGITFADIQVKVMSGMSAKDLIEYVKDKDTKKYSSNPVKFGEIDPEDEVCDIVVEGVKLPNPYSGYADQYFKKSTISNIRDADLYDKLRAWMIIYASNKLGTDDVDKISKYTSDALYLWFDKLTIAYVLENNPFEKYKPKEEK